MEFVSYGGIPEWVSSLSEMLEEDGRVGLLSYRSNVDKRSELNPSVYIGCCPGGNASNYPTGISDIMYGISNKSVVMLQYEYNESVAFTNVMPNYIVGKYHPNFSKLAVYVRGNSAIAICDINNKEIYLPDISSDMSYINDKESVIKSIADFVFYVVSFMETSYVDSLLVDIAGFEKSNTRVKLLEVKADTTFDRNGFIRECMGAIKSYESEIDSMYKGMFDKVRQDLRTAQEQGIVDALELMTYLKTKHFVFVSPGVIKYTGGKIKANTGIYNDALYRTNSELWISGLRVYIDDGVVVDARCYRAYHTNCSGRHVCLGELAGIPVRDVDKVVEAMKVPNFSNGYWSNSAQYLGEKIVDLEGEAERVWSSDD